ncbi:MAG: four helix bundle protein [Candidatus Acidiferrales bacterium]
MDSKLEKRNSKLAGKSSPPKPVKDFTDLEAWQLARELRKRIYELSARFPPHEKSVLTSQLRRAALSVTANTAEGFGRYSFKENLQYCRQARGSAYEARDQLIAALDAGYFSPEEWRAVDELAQRTIKVLNGYIRSTRARQDAKKDLR